MTRQTSSPPSDVRVNDQPMLRIGEVSERSGTTTRTLRYWEEMGLLQPAAHRESGERLYSVAELERVSHIRELQELLGLTLAEIKAVLHSEDAIDRARHARQSGAPIARRLRLIEEAIEAHDRVIERIDDRLARIGVFRDEWVVRGKRLKSRSAELKVEQAQLGDDA